MENQKELIALPAHILDLAMFTLRNGARPSLAHVHFGATEAAATDSYRMMIAPVKREATEPRDVFMEACDLEATSKGNKNKDLPASATIEASAENAYIKYVSTGKDGKQSSMDAKEYSGSYPAYKQILPTDRPLAVVCVNPDYMLSMAQYFKKHSPDGMIIEVYGHDRGIILKERIQNHGLTGILMPLKIDTPELRECEECKKREEIVAESFEPVKNEEEVPADTVTMKE